MTNQIDDFKDQDHLEGYLVVTRTNKDGSVEQEKIKNLVVSKAREIVRNLVFGETKTITGLALGDANIPASQALSKANIPNPTLIDVNLVHKTYEVGIVEKKKVTYEDRHAIKYSFYIDYEEGNGSGEDNFFTEAGLTLADGTLFTRLTFKALVKDSTSALSLEYYLLF